MDKLSKVSKIFLTITIISFIIWFGSYITRQLYIFQFFEPENMELQSSITQSSLSDILSLMLPILLINMIAYSFFIFSFLILLFLAKISLKREGWLFIITLIVFFTAPFEFYLLSIDYKITSLLLINYFDPNEIIGLLRERIVFFNSFPIIIIFLFTSSIILYLFKPLRKTQ